MWCYASPVKTVLPVECATALGLSVVGDEIELSVTAVNPDGSVEVSTEMDTPQEDAMSAAPMTAISPADLPPPPYA